MKAYSIAWEEPNSNAKALEKPQEQEILSLTWYTHQYANGGTREPNRLKRKREPETCQQNQ
jgi:hypothetical protein